MITFNDILTLGGLNPSEVKILRHGQVGDPRVYDTWRNDRPVFERYQALQGSSVIPEHGVRCEFRRESGSQDDLRRHVPKRGLDPDAVG